ncbi:MAG: sigma-54-dependent transcriptional regulator [Acidobacteriota bacterium]|jgi:DNA-binding NtrC family response regulator|nr:sigma-54 dependent transcriptional regulator [Bryobacteraceae bacterium CoA2 C42]MCA2965677.1 sigma-54-dependent Fis family transcriptional regulator [Acidobacteriaceae bacterium]
MIPSILLVEDDVSLRRIMQLRLEAASYRVTCAVCAEEAIAALERQPFHLVVSDLMMPGLSGLDLLKRIKADAPGTPVILLTAYGSVESAVDAMKSGAFDYLTKPVESTDLLMTVARALETQRLREEVQTLRSSVSAKYGFENIIGRSPNLLYVLDVAGRAAQTDSTVLINGETGTGKELLAKAIHFNSPRRDHPFVAINCGAIPRELLESELFGHIKGSFTGAIAHKKGRIEMAHGGTLFLDEIGEMPPELQVKLLRVIQEREIEKLGATEPTRVDVRLVAATHRNLAAMIEDGTFREDLYYRLAVIPLELPPLRERPSDIPDLVNFFFDRAKQRVNRPQLVFPPLLLPYFQGYRWPGNIRELENILERVAVLARSNEVALDDLPPKLAAVGAAPSALQLDLPTTGISLENVEKELILKALEKCDWNQTHAAKYLDISRKTLIYRMEKHGLARTIES